MQTYIETNDTQQKLQLIQYQHQDLICILKLKDFKEAVSICTPNIK